MLDGLADLVVRESAGAGCQAFWVGLVTRVRAGGAGVERSVGSGRKTAKRRDGTLDLGLALHCLDEVMDFHFLALARDTHREEDSCT